MEVFRDAVAQRSHIHQRSSRQVTEIQREAESSSLEDRVAKIERDASLTTSAGPSKKNGPPPKMDRTDKKRNKNQAYSAKVENNDAWKDQLLRAIQD